MGLSTLTPGPLPAPPQACTAGGDWAPGEGSPGPAQPWQRVPPAARGARPTRPGPASLSPRTLDAPHTLRNRHRWSEPLDINFQIKNEITFQSFPLRCSDVTTRSEGRSLPALTWDLRAVKDTRTPTSSRSLGAAGHSLAPGRLFLPGTGSAPAARGRGLLASGRRRASSGVPLSSRGDAGPVGPGPRPVTSSNPVTSGGASSAQTVTRGQGFTCALGEHSSAHACDRRCVTCQPLYCPHPPRPPRRKAPGSNPKHPGWLALPRGGPGAGAGTGSGPPAAGPAMLFSLRRLRRLASMA